MNTELLALYWQIGDSIRGRQEAAGWGAKVIDQLSADLRAEFPEMSGLSRSNVYYMRSFAAAWSLEAIVQQSAGLTARRSPPDHETRGAPSRAYAGQGVMVSGSVPYVSCQSGLVLENVDGSITCSAVTQSMSSWRISSWRL